MGELEEERHVHEEAEDGLEEVEEEEEIGVYEEDKYDAE